MPAQSFPSPRRQLLSLLLPCALLAPDARAIVINEEAFKRFGGDLSNIEGTAGRVDEQLLAESRKPRFHSAGLLKLTGIDRKGCHQTNGTWLGEDAAFVYILAGASCLSGKNVHATTRVAQVEFIDWQGRSVVSGEGRVFFPAHGKAMAMALVRVPRPADRPLDVLRPLLPPVWINDTFGDRAGRGDPSMEVVAYGRGGVGNSEDRQPARRFGVAGRRDFSRDDPNAMYLDYDATTGSENWARGAGDNGGGWYERGEHEGMLTGLTTWFNPTMTAATRVAAHALWIEGLYPDVRIARRVAHAFNGSWAEAYPLTERRALVTTDLSLNGLTGERRRGLYFKVPSAPDGGVPMPSGTPGHTRFQITVKDERTSVPTQLTLRGQKIAPCVGLLAMNDSHDCPEGGDGRLMLSYWPEDNLTLAQGRVFVGTFDIGAIFDRVDASNFSLVSPEVWRVDVRISTRKLGRVTATRPFEWDYKGAVQRAGAFKEGDSRRPNRFTFRVPEQAGVEESVEVTTNRKAEKPYSLIRVVAHDVLQQTSEWEQVSPGSYDRHMPRTTRVIHLRAQVGRGCGGAKPCAPRDWKRRLTVSFAKEDNLGLPPGIYRGRFDMDGSHASGAGAEQNKLSVDVDVETL